MVIFNMNPQFCKISSYDRDGLYLSENTGDAIISVWCVTSVCVSVLQLAWELYWNALIHQITTIRRYANRTHNACKYLNPKIITSFTHNSYLQKALQFLNIFPIRLEITTLNSEDETRREINDVVHTNWKYWYSLQEYVTIFTRKRQLGVTCNWLYKSCSFFKKQTSKSLSHVFNAIILVII